MDYFWPRWNLHGWTLAPIHLDLQLPLPLMPLDTDASNVFNIMKQSLRNVSISMHPRWTPQAFRRVVDRCRSDCEQVLDAMSI
jgi:hypothetical protein